MLGQGAVGGRDPGVADVSRKRIAACALTGVLGLTAAAATAGPLADLDAIDSLPMPARQTAAERFLATHPENPIRDGETLLIAYAGPGDDLKLAGDQTDWSPDLPLTHVPGTNLWRLDLDLPPTARLDYKLVRDGVWILDPRNSRTAVSGFGSNSEIRGPKYSPPAFVTASPRAACRLDTLDVATPQLGGSRKVVVIVPPGGEDPARRYLLVHDGLEYIDFAGLDRALAWLSETEPDLPLPICVCVPPVRRTEEYATDLQADFGRFIVDTLTPRIEARYGTRGPWGSMGPSYGGRITLHLAQRYPDRFDRVAAMSPSVAPEQHEGIAALDPSALRLYVNWGTYDIRRLIPGCERFVEMLQERGFEHEVQVEPQGHAWYFWRDTLIPALKYLYGSK